MNYLDLDFLNRVEYPQVLLCNRSKKILGEIYPVERLNVTMNYNYPHEISFQIHKMCNGVKNYLWEQLQDLKLIKLKYFGYFEIYVRDYIDVKEIRGKSIDIELGQVILNDFQINSDELEDSDYKESISFYKPTEPAQSLLHLIMAKAPAWNIGHVDSTLWDKQRTFDIDNTAVYDFLTGDVADQFKCIFQFDTFNRTVECYDLETAGKNANVYISRGNFATELNIEAKVDEIKNCFYVVGGDGVNINEISPNGTNYIWAFSSRDKQDMTKELVDKLDSYDILFQSKTSQYEEIMKKLQAQISVIDNLKYAKTVDGEEDIKKTSLVYLEIAHKSNLDQEAVYQSSGVSDPSNSNYLSLYVPLHNKTIALEAEIKTRKEQIKTEEDKYKEYKKEISTIQKDLNIEDYLGTELWKELSLYRREHRYENTNYSVTDSMTDTERFELAKQLYDEANKEIQIAKEPKYNFSIPMNNMLASPHFQKYHIEEFALGNFMIIGHDDNEHISKARCVSFSIDFDELKSIKMEFSDMTEIKNMMSDVRDSFQKAVSAATSYGTIMRQYEKAKNSIGFVDNMIKDGLNASLIDIKNSDNQEVTMNKRGLLCRQWNEDKGDYEKEQLQVINNKIVMTDDAWSSARMAIGKVNYNGTNVYGIIADLIAGDLVASKSLHIGNTNNTFVVDENGAVLTNADLTVTNGTNTIKISPSGDSCFQILKGTEKQIYMDAEGNAHFKGDLSGATGTFSGLVSGGSININNKFTVDASGNMVAQGGTFSGIINGTTINGGTISGTSINGGSVTGTNITGGFISGAIINGGTITGGSFESSNGKNATTRISDGQITTTAIVLKDFTTGALGMCLLSSGLESDNRQYYFKSDGSVKAQSFSTNSLTLSGGTLQPTGEGTLWIGQNTVKANSIQALSSLTINGSAVATQDYVENQYNRAYSAGYSKGLKDGAKK